MSDLVTVAIITATPMTLAAIASLIASLRNGKKIEALHLEVDGKLQQFIALTEKSSFAEGVKSETDKK